MTSTQQMKKYKVDVNLSKIYRAIQPYKLREFKPIPVLREGKRMYIASLKITAKSPDDVCYRTMKNLIDLLRDQNVQEPIIYDVKNIASIQKIELLDE